MKPRRTATGTKIHLGFDGMRQFACGARGTGSPLLNAEVTCAKCAQSHFHTRWLEWASK
jgi:hypothetical protein